MKILTVDIATYQQWKDKTAGFFLDPDPRRTYITFNDPVDVLELITPARLRIVQLLMAAGPLPAQMIAGRLRRNPLSLDRDLEALLDTEVLSIDRHERLYYEFDGLQLLLRWPVPDTSDEPHGKAAQARRARGRRRATRFSRRRHG